MSEMEELVGKTITNVWVEEGATIREVLEDFKEKKGFKIVDSDMVTIK